MCCSRLLVTWLFVVGCGPAIAAEYVIGAGVSLDNEEGRGLTLLGDVALGEKTWLGASVSTTQVKAVDETLRSRAAALTLTQQFGNFAVNASAGIWGDPDALDSRDFGLGLTYTGEAWRIGVEAEQRDLDLTFTLLPLLPGGQPLSRSAGAKADGLGARIRYKSANDTSWSVRAKRFDYDRDLNRLTALDLVRRLVPTTLILADGLRDTSIAGAVEWPVGSHLVGIEVSRDRLGIGDIDIDGVAVNWVRPVGTRGDLEFVLGASRADGSDSSVYLQVLYYYFGGS